MSVARKVLLADPIMYSHSLHYYRAALASTGYEEAEFTVATQAIDEPDRQRLLDFAKSEPRLKVRLLGVLNHPCIKRGESWRAFARGMRRIEAVLKTNSFDEVVYMYLDFALVFFALPIFRPWLRAHYRAGIAGLIFRDNGLRAPALELGSARARFRAPIDRYLLGRALKKGPFRKVAFLDHWCRDRAVELWGCNYCQYGIDPVFDSPCDVGQSRALLGLQPDDFAILFFGSMADRKAVAECLAMLRQAPLPPGRTAIVIAGPSAASYRERLNQEIAAAARQYRVIHHDRFITDAELPPYFAAADCVVCVYKEFTGSSSVLLHGAICGKPALVSAGGAMADAVRKHDFGEVVSLADPQGFISAICKLAALDPAQRQALASRALAYGRSMDARRFMSQFA